MVRRRQPRLALWALLAALLAAAPSPPLAVAQQRNFQSKEFRPLERTAYTLMSGHWQGQLGAYGVNREDIYAMLDVAYGLGAGVQLSANVFHYTTGLWNLSAKWMFYDGPVAALAVSTGIVWGNGKWMWTLTQPARSLMQDVQLISVPVGLHSSFVLTPWLQLDLGVGYHHVTGFGDIRLGPLALDGFLTQNEIYARPSVRLFVLDRLAVNVSAHLPLWARRPVNVTTSVTLPARTQSFQTVALETVPFEDGVAFGIGVESPLTDHLSVAIDVNYAAHARSLYATPILPTMRVILRL